MRMKKKYKGATVYSPVLKHKLVITDHEDNYDFYKAAGLGFIFSEPKAEKLPKEKKAKKDKAGDSDTAE